MLVYLITHVATAQQQAQDATQWGLSEAGRVQAAGLAAASFWATVEQVIVSSEAKAFLSVASVVGERGLPVWVDSRLDELRRGRWADDYGAQVAEMFTDPDRGVGEWEAAGAALERVCGALAAIERRFSGKTVALVGHGLTLSLLRAHYLGLARVRYDDWARLSFGAVAAVELPGGRWVQDFALAESVRRG
ncbi:MAG: histidine phosphatase family protein [Caldilineaceae bacterium]|nr:histidine phosphatase family protein [Caldilineaceae bacterium]